MEAIKREWIEEEISGLVNDLKECGLFPDSAACVVLAGSPRAGRGWTLQTEQPLPACVVGDSNNRHRVDFGNGRDAFRLIVELRKRVGLQVVTERTAQRETLAQLVALGLVSGVVAELVRTFVTDGLAFNDALAASAALNS